MLRDKSVQDFLAEFDVTRFHITLTQASSHRALSADEIQQTADLHHANIVIQPRFTNCHQSGSKRFRLADCHYRLTPHRRLAREMLGLLNETDLQEAYMTRAIFEGADYLTKLR